MPSIHLLSIFHTNVLWIDSYRKQYTQHNKQCLKPFCVLLYTLQGFTDAQMQQVQENSVLVAEREKEIAVILQSIREIHQFFQDIAMLVVEQGTVLDRIDYNIEHAAVRVAEGRQQLEKVCSSMCVCVHTFLQYTHGHTSSTHIQIHIRTYVHIHTYTHTHVYVHTHTHTHMYVRTYTCTCTYIYVRTYAYTYTYTYRRLYTWGQRENCVLYTQLQLMPCMHT